LQSRMIHRPGWDHVSGYPHHGLCLSAPTPNATPVVSTQYNQTSLLRTMELNAWPAADEPDGPPPPRRCSDCFNNTPNFTAFDAVTNSVPLYEVNPAPKKNFRRANSAKTRLFSARLPLDQPGPMQRGRAEPHFSGAQTMATPYPEWGRSKIVG